MKLTTAYSLTNKTPTLIQISKLKVKLVNTARASVTADCAVSDAGYNRRHHHHHPMSKCAKSASKTAGYAQTAATYTHKHMHVDNTAA